MQPFAALSLGVWAPVTHGEWSSGCWVMLGLLLAALVCVGIIKETFVKLTEEGQPWWPFPIVIVASVVFTVKVINWSGDVQRSGLDFWTVLWWGLPASSGVCLVYLAIRASVGAAKDKGGK